MPAFSIAIFLGIIATLAFSTLTYALRDFVRTRLAEQLEACGRAHRFQAIVDHIDDLIVATATLRLLANLVIFLGILLLHPSAGDRNWVHYAIAFFIASLVCFVVSIAVPHAVARYGGEAIIAAFSGLLPVVRIALLPLVKIVQGIDGLVRRIAGISPEAEPEHIEQEILSVVEEGEKEGVVDGEEREMIESIIEFHDTQAGQIMTARPEIVALEITAGLEEAKRTVEESGHSRIPVYQGALDHIVGILYARDLLKQLASPPEQFDIRATMRPATFVPETKPLRDLLREFRMQKVHIAIVLDEYGGTAGLVTIEDILEELVGEITDEHEPAEPAMLKRIGENAFEADARLPIEELNGKVGLNIPEDAGYDTLGGFVSITLGRIPAKGTTFDWQQVRYSILDAEPQRVKRLRIDLLPQPVSGPPQAGSK